MLFLFLLLLISKAITWQQRVLLCKSDPCLSPWMVLNFPSPLQRVHKQLVLSPLCSCYQNKQKFTRTCKRKCSTDSSRKSAAFRAISDSQLARIYSHNKILSPDRPTLDRTRNSLLSRVTLRVREAIFQSPICLHGALITVLNAQGNFLLSFLKFLPLWHRHYCLADCKLRTHTQLRTPFEVSTFPISYGK